MSRLTFFVASPGLGLWNWLVVLFELHAGIGGLPVDPLRVLNPLDFAVLAFVGITFRGLWPALIAQIHSTLPSAPLRENNKARIPTRAFVTEGGVMINENLLRGSALL